MVNVPAQYDPLVRQMSSETGIPYSVVAAQAYMESGFNATARSGAGALGWLQFLPSTYDTYAEQAGVGKGTEFNPASEAKVYAVYMRSLLKQEHGDLRKALAAYNAGPGNLQAGYGYADKILAQAGQKGSVITTGLPVPGLGSIPGLGGGLSISGILGNVLGDMRDVLERLGLILLGAVLILLGIHMLAGSGNAVTNNYAVEQAKKGAKEDTAGKAKSGATKGASKTGVAEAAEAAAIA
jgi:transglycosylase-like protein with SLT domain